MMRSKKLPYPIKVLTHGIRLPSYISFFEAKNVQHDQMLSDLEHQISELQGDLHKANVLLGTYQKMDDKIIDIYHQMSLSLQENKVTKSTATVVNATVSDDHRFDQFYKAFEDKFRGSEELIKTRLLEHLPLFKSLPEVLQKKPIVDIGCGRGELLSVLKENKFKAIGIDMNKSMVNRATEAGFEAHNTDALSYLTTLKTGALSSVTGFHIVEHIPFEPLMAIFKECYRVIDRGGFALFETPNPETLSVGSHTFYLDPSHLRPVPPQLLAFMLEYSGFSCEIIRLHIIDKLPVSVKSPYIRKLYNASFGPADYAVVARKI